MKNILVPTDFSECAENALKFAATFARKTKGKLKIVHVYEYPMYGFSSIDYHLRSHEILQTGIKRKMQELMNKKYLRNIPLVTKLITEKSLREIFTDNFLSNVDLMVMGTHGANGLNELVIGSNAEKLARAANIPMITVRNNPPAKVLKDIVFATDFGPEAVDAYKKVREVAEIFGSRIHLLRVNTPGEFEETLKTKRSIKQFLSKTTGQKDVVAVYNDKTKEGGIVKYAHQVNAMLIALGTHGRRGLSRFFDHSVSTGLVNHSSAPVLTVNFDRYQSTKAVSYGRGTTRIRTRNKPELLK